MAYAHPFEQRAPVAARRLRAHRLGGRQACRGRDRIQRAEHRGRQRQPTADPEQPGRDTVLEAREAEEVRVQPRERGAQLIADHQPQQPADAHDDQHHLQVVEGDGRVRVAQGLQRGDLLSLRGDQPGDDHVEQERRDTEEDRWQQRAQHALLLDLVVEHRVRGLVGAAMRLPAPVGVEHAGQAVDHRALVAVRRQLQRQMVECAGHVERRRQRLVVDPEDTEATLVGHAPQAGEDVFGRERHPRHQQRAPLAVDQRRQPRTGLQLVGRRERFRHPGRNRSIGERRAGRGRGSGATQHDEVHARRPTRIDADQLPDDRFAAALDLDPHGHFDAGLHVGHAGQRAQCVGDRQRSALEAREHIGEARLGVEAVARQGQRVDGRQRGDESGHAAGHHQRDGQHLAPHRAQVAHQLAIQGLHVTSSVATATACARWSRRAGFARRRGGSRDRPCRQWPRCA